MEGRTTAILRLKEQGINRMFLLSGDNSRVAAALARSLGIADGGRTKAA